MGRTNTFIVEDAHQLGISKMVLGRLRGIRGSSHISAKANAIISNFWSFNYAVRRFREKAEEYGIKVEEISEYKTSTRAATLKTQQPKGRLPNAWTVG